MLFGEKYDLSLGYILKVKNHFSKKTIEFIKELPEELIENIRNTYDEGIDRNHGVFDMTNSEKRPRSFYEVYSKDTPDICYKFFIMSNELYIIKSKIVNEAKVDVFSLTLNPLEARDISKMAYQAKYKLGSVSVGEYCKLNFTEMEYNLEKIKTGYGIKRSYSILSSNIEMKTKKLDDSTSIQDEVLDSQRLVYRLRK